MKIKESCHLPQMYDGTNPLGDSNIFRTSDAYNRYWKVFIAPQPRHNTSSVYYSGTYKYI